MGERCGVRMAGSAGCQPAALGSESTLSEGFFICTQRHGHLIDMCVQHLSISNHLDLMSIIYVHAIYDE